MTEITPVPALGISIQAAVGDGLQIVFQTHVDQATPPKELNAMLDRLTAATKRQQAKVDLVALEKNLKVNLAQLERQREDRSRIEATLSTPDPTRRLTNKNEADLKQKREQADVNEKRMQDMIRDIQEEITKTQALIAQDG